MKFDGRAYAQEIYQQLTQRVTKLKEQGITPRMAVILVGENPNSLSYIKQKKKWGTAIGAEIIVHQFEESISEKELLQVITHFNQDQNIHGIIVQLPLPHHLDDKKLIYTVAMEKDVDGFQEGSAYHVPVAYAVYKILEEIHSEQNFEKWIHQQHIVVLGKGKTAGHPIIELLQKKSLSPTIVDHATENPKEIIQKADIIISCVGKIVIQKEMVKPHAILIGVGLHVEENGKLQGDFIESEIENHVHAYTPTPGGVGPVNVACLLKNLVTAAENIASQ